MAEREQSMVVSRQAILLVTAMGVGLLTLSYVLGVQMGKQSAAIRKPLAKTVDEQLKELPEPLAEQLKNFEGADAMGLENSRKQTDKPEEHKPEAEKPEASKEGDKWTLQCVSTSDPGEAKRVAEKVKAAGYATTTVKEKEQLKVRLAKPASRADIERASAKLKEKGLKPFAMKVD